MATAARLSEIESRFTDPRWRLNNLYTITDKAGQAIPFRLNWAQEEFLDNIWYLNIILKARQLGFTTLIDLLILDQCVFTSNVRAGIIAHTVEDAKAFFKDKVKFPYDNLEEGIRNANPAIQDSANALSFRNNSSVRVGTSLRSGTLQYLHVSEYGKICAKYPEKAKEIKTGALNTVAAGQHVFIESTAEGREGAFYDMCEKSKALAQSDKKLTEMDFKFLFYPWWRDPSYRLPAANVTLTAENKKYFDVLEGNGISLDGDQKAWYAKKQEQQNEDMQKEYPSTPEEAFEVAIEGAYFKRQMAVVRKQQRICRIPVEAALPVNTFWDLGLNDQMVIWLHQQHQKEHRFVGFYENAGEGFIHYKNWLNQWLEDNGATFGQHFAPHDIEVRSLGAHAETRKAIAAKIGLKFETVPRVVAKNDAIESARTVLPQCWFDEANCAKGIHYLDHYRKEWNEKMEVWSDKPRHDAASHGADGFMTFATAIEKGLIGIKDDSDVLRNLARSTTAPQSHGWMG